MVKSRIPKAPGTIATEKIEAFASRADNEEKQPAAQSPPSTPPAAAPVNNTARIVRTTISMPQELFDEITDLIHQNKRDRGDGIKNMSEFFRKAAQDYLIKGSQDY